MRALRKTYRRDHVDKLIPTQYRELFVELLSGQRPEFPRAMLAQLAKFDRDWGAVRAGARLIRHLAAEEVLVAGDLGDRGPRIDRVIDTTGCGDSFAAGMAFGYLLDGDIVTACRYGNAIGAQRASATKLDGYSDRETTAAQIQAAFGG